MHTRPITEAQLAANRANAAHSTGPKTEAGRQISSHNALKTGLTGRTVLLPSDDAAIYEQHCARIQASHQPKTSEERAHVDTIANLEWRLLRIPALESGIYALGHKRLAAQFAFDPAANRATLIDSEIWVVYQKELKNLYLQESRLVRRLEKEFIALAALQQQRKAEEKARLAEAEAYYRDCIEQDIPYDQTLLAEAGFEFSIVDIQRAVAARQARQTHPKWQTIAAAEIVRSMSAQKMV